MADLCDVLIVGGGHAGAQAAIALRQRKFDGQIAILTDETCLPYDRPALSKEYLAGEKAFDRILLRPEPFWAERNIHVYLGERAKSIDAAKHEVRTGAGEVYTYRHLIWAAGGSPRRLACEGSDLRGVHTIRNRPDVDQLSSELGAAKTACVIGGGYIGLEAAAVLRKLGLRVVVLEAQARLLARVAGRALSDFFAAEHRAHGVEVHLGATVATLEGRDGAVCGVRLATGEVIPCEIAVVGIGIVPNVGPLLEAGAIGGNGVLVDPLCRTSLADVFAIGDCALHANAFAGGQSIRLESVQNASDMATTVAKVLTDQPEPYAATPWFWSNQYDLRLQTIGLNLDHDAEVLRGDPATRSFSIIYLKAGRVVAIDAVNNTRDYVQGKALVQAGLTLDPALLADTSRTLKDIAEADAA